MGIKSIGRTGVILLIVALLLMIAGAVGIWLGANGIVINGIYLHFGATTLIEIESGIVFFSVGTAVMASFLLLYHYARPLLS